VRSDGSPSGVSRMHRLMSDTPGLVSVIGGKLTGYRAIAEEVVDRLCGELQVSARSTTATTPLPGGGAERSGVPHLDAIYGSRAPRVQALAAADPALARPLAAGHPDIAAEVVYSARHEWCGRVEDFLRRRSYLGFQPDRGQAATLNIEAALPAIPQT
jgi:glycerol-3-phosphate dehydrogenase